MLELQQALQHGNHCFFTEYAQKHFYLQNLQIYINILMYESEHSYSPQPTPTKDRAVEIVPCRTSTIKLHVKILEFKNNRLVQLPRNIGGLLHKPLSPVPHPVQFSSAEVFSNDWPGFSPGTTTPPPSPQKVNSPSNLTNCKTCIWNLDVLPMFQPIVPFFPGNKSKPSIRKQQAWQSRTFHPLNA